jgi:hypothetical protein
VGGFSIELVTQRAIHTSNTKETLKKNYYEGGTDIALLTVYKDETINPKT